MVFITQLAIAAAAANKSFQPTAALYARNLIGFEVSARRLNSSVRQQREESEIQDS